MPGGDWSGKPGHRCDVCNRRSENVGPRRGFDYANDVCGGCCDISSDEDEYNCNSCKKNLYKRQTQVEGYCFDCVGYCQVCMQDIHPNDEVERPLDDDVRSLVGDPEEAEERFGDGDVTLCPECAEDLAAKKKEKEPAGKNIKSTHVKGGDEAGATAPSK